MAFQMYATYGKRRNRVVKTEVWITPEKTKYFSSCSSDSTETTSSFECDSAETTARSTIEKKQKAVHLSSESKDLDSTSSSLSSGFGSRSTESSSKDSTSSIQDFAEGEACLTKDDEKNSVFLEHSTPLSTKNYQKTNCLAIKEISPFPMLDSYQVDSNNTPKTDGYDHPSLDLFSSLSLSVNEDNCKIPSGYNITATTCTEVDHILCLSTNSKTSSQSSRSKHKDSCSNIQQVSDQLKDLKLLNVKVRLDSCETLKLLKQNKSKKEGTMLVNGSKNIDPKCKSSHVKKISYNIQDSHSHFGTKEHMGDEEHRWMVTNDNNIQIGKSPLILPSTPVNLCLKNVTEKSLSFVEALTPLRFQRRKTLTPKEKVLIQCEQEQVMKFTDAFTKQALENCVKVGEGTYGEVFKTSDGDDDVAIKIIPIEGNFAVNGEGQKSFQEIMPEIVISKELSELCNLENEPYLLHSCPNFIKLKRVILIQDNYPEKLLHEWDEWKKTHECENERPDMFQPDQYFTVFEFADGGEALENFQFSTLDEAVSVLQQTILSLAVAEQSLDFEHRDLHWGNVLINRTKHEVLHYKLNGDDIELENNGVFVSIIDFTLSRLTKDGVTVFCDLREDPDIFTGKGDYQFEVYRLMRKRNKDIWESHEPYSNVLWIRYLVDKIINFKEFPIKNKALLRNMRSFLRRVLSYDSALEAVEDDLLGFV